MSKIVQVINSLPNLLALRPADKTQIDDAAIQLRISFAEEYKEYLAEFGAILADGIELSGIAKSDHRSVVTLTQKEWSLNPKVPHNMYVIENTNMDGIVMWQDADGVIYQSRPFVEPVKISSSLSDYLLSRRR